MIPNLIHPIPVEIEQIDKENTFYDESAREPVKTVARKQKITLSAQVSWGEKDEPSPDKAGVIETSRGYLLFSLAELSQKGITLQRGDRITKIGAMSLDLEIMSTQPAGHYPDQGGPTLLQAFFS